VPYLQIEQPPDAIIVVAISGPMFSKKLFDRGALEESAIHAAGLEQQILNLIQLGASQPAAPRCRKS